jgi:hypothetical protein
VLYAENKIVLRQQEAGGYQYHTLSCGHRHQVTRSIAWRNTETMPCIHCPRPSTWYQAKFECRCVGPGPLMIPGKNDPPPGPDLRIPEIMGVIEIEAFENDFKDAERRMLIDIDKRHSPRYWDTTIVKLEQRGGFGPYADSV